MHKGTLRVVHAACFQLREMSIARSLLVPIPLALSLAGTGAIAQTGPASTGPTLSRAVDAGSIQTLKDMGRACRR
jgi:hypothetical protein